MLLRGSFAPEFYNIQKPEIIWVGGGISEMLELKTAYLELPSGLGG